MKPTARKICGLSVVLLIVGLVALGGLGCAQSPQAKMQKAVALGEKYLKEGKANEAIIEFRNALQIDQNFVPALQGLGRAYAAKSWYGDAFRELQRAQQLSALTQADLFVPVRVADYLLEKDRLFARVTLDENEYALYEQLYAKLDIQAPKPDLVVYLQAPVDVLLERIAKRGVEYEQYIDRAYLERLNEAYARFFHEFESAPLLIVNAASIDPISNQRDYDELLAAIRRMSRGRLYFNPLRSRAI